MIEQLEFPFEPYTEHLMKHYRQAKAKQEEYATLAANYLLQAQTMCKHENTTSKKDYHRDDYDRWTNSYTLITECKICGKKEFVEGSDY
jgi:hypothetical protein